MRKERIQLLSTKLTSSSLYRLAKELSHRLGYKVFRTKKVRPTRKQYRYGDLKDKVYQYRWFTQNNIPCPEWTVERAQAEQWIQEGHVVFCRTLTRASEGRGIAVAETVDQLVPAPVYTKYTKKKREYRVHVFKNKVVSILEKRKRVGWSEERDTRIRNTANGYVFCRSLGAGAPAGLIELAVAARAVTQSDFVGVDIGYNERRNQLFVIEVNSAPGIEGSNINDYVDNILNTQS